MSTKGAVFARKHLGEIVSYPESIISVYTVEHHIWAGSQDVVASENAKRERRAELKTIEEYLIDPVRSLLVDVFQHLSAPHDQGRKDNPIGQGYWIQAEFGSGKSHLLSFIGALALGQKELWEKVNEKEKSSGKGKRESLYQFYEGIAKKSGGKSKGIFVVAKTLVGHGGSQGGGVDKGRAFVEYIIEAVKDQYYAETGETIALYPTELLSRWFLDHDLKLLGKDFEKFLRDPKEFDEEEQWSLNEFLDKLQDSGSSEALRECGKRLWDYYEKRRGGVPQNIIPEDTEPLLKYVVEELMRKGYAGVLFILDEVSLFMQSRPEQRAEDEKTLVVLSNRLVHLHNLPVWTICAAQQRIESKMTEKNIIANERLKMVPLLKSEEDYYDIVLSRIRRIDNRALIEAYWDDYSRGFTWPKAVSRERFEKFFPFHPDAIEVMKKLSDQLTTIRAGLDILLQTLRAQTKGKSDELVTMWAMFNDLLVYEEDPSGTTKAIASVKTQWHDEWKSYELGKKRIDSATKGHLKVYRNRCLKILKTLFLFSVANMATDGLSSEQIMNCVMEWKDHEKDQNADSKDNLDHYEMLVEQLELEVAQVSKLNNKYLFKSVSGGRDPQEVFEEARNKAESDETLQKHAWEHLLNLGEWKIESNLVTMDLSYNLRSIFKDVAPQAQSDMTITWHGREIQGRVMMRDLRDISKREAILPSLNTPESGLDYCVFISSTPCGDEIPRLIDKAKDPRVVYWTPDILTNTEKDLLIDFAAYRRMVEEYRSKDTDEAREMISWVHNRLKAGLGTMYRIVPDSFSRGRISAAAHADLNFTCTGDLTQILSPVVTRVLDSVYKSKDLEFTASTAFNDTEAIKVINGIVKVGQISKETKKDKDYSAAQNFGYALKIMKKSNDKKLDTGGNEFLDSIRTFIDEKMDTSLPVDTLCRNFMGINGPNGIHYGLSARMIQLYLLCLVQEGRIKVTLKGKGAAVEYIDCTNIAEIDFKAATLEALDRIFPVKSPEGWEVLAPLASLYLKEEGLLTITQDADIRGAVRKLLEKKDSQLPTVLALSADMDDLFGHIKVENPARETLSAWAAFLSAPVDGEDPISYLRSGFEKAFKYDVYSTEVVKQDYLQDFKLRLKELDNLSRFQVHTRRIKTIFDYTQVLLPDDSNLDGLKKNIESICGALKNISECIENESKLQTDILDPAEKTISAYSSRYLQAYDQVVHQTECAKHDIDALKQRGAFEALIALYSIEQLSGDINSVELKLQEIKESLFSCPSTLQDVESALKVSPAVPDCPLTLENASALAQKADEALTEAQKFVRDKLKEKAVLFFSGPLRVRLEQGKSEEVIRSVLECPDEESLVTLLAEKLWANPDLVNAFKKYLKKISMRKLKVADFKPTKKSIETEEVEGVVNEFRTFVKRAFKKESPEEHPVVEFE